MLIKMILEVISKKPTQKGYLKFSDLEVGIYLLRVSNYAKYEYVEATLITVPTYNEDVQNSMNFDITVIIPLSKYRYLNRI